MPSFEELSDLAQLVQPNKIKNLVLLGATSNPTTKLDKFYHGLVHQNFKGEEEAAAALFQEGPQYAAYYKLKERLYERMLSTLFFIDINESKLTEKQLVYQICLRNSHAIKILFAKGARQAAIPLAEKTVKKAEKFEFTDIILSISNDLRTHYATIVGDKNNFKKYNLIVQKFLEIQEAEFKAEEYYSNLAFHYVYSRASKFNLVKTSEFYAIELTKQLSKTQSFKLFFISYLVFTIRYEIINDYKNTLKVCEEALNYFEKRTHLVSKNSIFTFSFKMLAAYIHLKEYKEAEKKALSCLKLMPEGVTNWYIAMDYYLLQAFHSKKFQKAYDIYLKGISHPQFNNQYPYIAERWRIHKAFIYYLITCGKIVPPTESIQNSKKFRLNKFLNEVPAYSKDKRGTNITILILHILFLLQQQKHGEIIDRVESLKTYAHRYLRQDDTFRSNCFIKMLLQLPAASFHKKGVIRKVKKYWDKLLSVPLEEANQSSELEFIPYETLWEFVLDSLDNRFH